MEQKPRSIMLIDDNSDDNFFHSRVIKKSGKEVEIITHTSAEEALRSLQETNIFPDLIFLDINMPRMNGWEFLDELDDPKFSGHNTSVIVMLSTSDNPDDKKKAHDNSYLADFCTKPLTKEALEKIIDSYF